MNYRIHTNLATWFEQGLQTGRFTVPNGRHIVLNQYPRLMRVTRLLASAGVKHERFRDFLIDLNPNVMTIPDGSAPALRQQLEQETDQLPGLRQVYVKIPPNQKLERWFVYTPPLDVMRRRWSQVRSQLI